MPGRKHDCNYVDGYYSIPALKVANGARVNEAMGVLQQSAAVQNQFCANPPDPDFPCRIRQLPEPRRWTLDAPGGSPCRGGPLSVTISGGCNPVDFPNRLF